MEKEGFGGVIDKGKGQKTWAAWCGDKGELQKRVQGKVRRGKAERGRNNGKREMLGYIEGRGGK